MVFAKLHVGLSVTTMVVAVAMIVWVIFINTDTIPQIHRTNSVLEAMGDSNSADIFSRNVQEKAQKSLDILVKYENLFTATFSLMVVGSIIFMVRGTVLLMTVSGEACYNCCGPVQFVWIKVHREVNQCLMETTMSHSMKDKTEPEEALDDDVEVTPATTIV